LTERYEGLCKEEETPGGKDDEGEGHGAMAQETKEGDTNLGQAPANRDDAMAVLRAGEGRVDMNPHQVALINRFGPKAIKQAQENCRKCKHCRKLTEDELLYGLRCNPCSQNLLPLTEHGPGCPYFKWAEGMKP